MKALRSKPTACPGAKPSWWFWSCEFSEIDLSACPGPLTAVARPASAPVDDSGVHSSPDGRELLPEIVQLLLGRFDLNGDEFALALELPQNVVTQADRHPFAYESEFLQPAAVQADLLLVEAVGGEVLSGLCVHDPELSVLHLD